MTKQSDCTVLCAPSDTDIGNARRMAAIHGRDLRFTPERGWLIWDGRRWAADEKQVELQARAKATAEALFSDVSNAQNRDDTYRHAKRSQSRRSIEAMIWLVRSERGLPGRLTDFDSDGWLFNCANGTLNLRTRLLQPQRRENCITAISEVAYDADAKSPRWVAFIDQISGNDADLAQYLKRLVGYLLVGDTSEQVLHFFHGTGANGKSVFCEVIQRLLGEYACVSSPDLIMLKRHAGIPNDVARLRGIRAAFMNETNEGARFDEAKLKDLTGGDSLTARFLHQEFFDFPPTHRILIRGNHKPTIRGRDEGIWRRLRLVPFSVTIPEDKRDPRLFSKLQDELPGILNWALEGCVEWQRYGLKPPSVVAEAVRAYRSECDTLAHFIEDRCTLDSSARTNASALQQSYRTYCEQSGESPISCKELPIELEKRQVYRKRSAGGSQYAGIALRDTINSDP